MKKYILPSLVLASVFVIVLLLRDPETQKTPSYVTLGNILLSLTITFLIIRRYKLVYSNNILSFGEAFKYGLKVTLCYATITAVIYFIYLQFNMDSFIRAMETQVKLEQERTLEWTGEHSASQEKAMKTMFTIMSNPFVLGGVTFIGSVFSGLIYSLISAAILKSKTKNQESSM